MTEVILVRHGATEWSASGRHTSVTDLPLTPAGEEGARAVGRWLAGRRVAAVLTSPRARARQTCALAGLSDRARVDEDLAEWWYGAYEGLTTARIREENPNWTIWADGAPGGETPEEVGRRADRVLGRLRALPDEGDVAVFSHGHFLRALAARWVGLGVEWGGALMLDAGAVSVLGHERETPALRLWNLRPGETAAGGAGAPPA